MRRFHNIAMGLVMMAAMLSASVVAAGPIPAGWKAYNMRPVGYTDVGGRPAFKMAIKQHQGRWYLFAANLWHAGFSIIDVTDVANPRFIKFVPAPDPNVWEIQVSLHGDLMITALEKPAPGWGFYDARKWKPENEGLLLWDISDPVNPKLLSHWRTGSDGLHRNSYPGGRYAFLAGAEPGFRSNHLIILDVSDPKNPQVAGRWWTPGQKVGEPESNNPAEGFHGPPVYSLDGKILTMGYSGAIYNVDITDVANPKTIGSLKLSPPFSTAYGPTAMHSVQSLKNGMILANSEAIPPGCGHASLLFAGIVDNNDKRSPKLISVLPAPQPPSDADFKSFCDRGGRFGPHNTNQETHADDVEEVGDIVYMTWFNAGLRVFDVSDPYVPKETGWFLPAQPTKRVGPQPTDKLVSQTEDVLVDTRGNIYISDKQWGIHILRYSGPNQPPPTAR
jgi:hypothetical protein